MASRRAVGDVRPSQLVTAFGPGALVDLQTLSIIVAGTDRWPVDPDCMIHEHRLQRALGVDAFHTAPPSTGGLFSRLGTIPAYFFPRYQLCPRCHILTAIGEQLVGYDERARELLCKAPGCKGRAGGKKRAATLPAPFIVACPSGHVDDFPWRDYVHRGSTTCTGRLSFYSIGRTGAVADLWIECTCNAKRSMTDAFGEHQSEVLGPCTRRRPWLGVQDRDPSDCARSSEVRALQRGATNGWFPVVRSALAVEETATPLGQALAKCSPRQLEQINSIEKLERFLEFEGHLTSFPIEDVWQTLCKMRGEIGVDESELRWQEWIAFRDPSGTTREQDELYLEEASVPNAFTKQIIRVVRARKLLEVRALLGFTRIEPPSQADPDVVAPLSREPQTWLPAIEVRGEGIFLELNEAAVARWESEPAVVERVRSINAKHAEWERQRGAQTTAPVPGRYILLHTLAHTLIRQVSLDCGYSASAVRERIYSAAGPDRSMAGVLLYTATPDSEGSLGGLVDLATSDRLPGLLANALESTTRCSSDPLCADHAPEAHASVNGAACHSCLLASETSCECFNRFLDRSTLVPTIATGALAFFSLPT